MRIDCQDKQIDNADAAGHTDHRWQDGNSVMI